MRTDMHNRSLRVFAVAWPALLALLTLGFVALFSMTGAAVVDADNGTEIGNETVSVDNETADVLVDLTTDATVANETNVTAYVYNGTDLANVSTVANATATFNTSGENVSLRMDVSGATAGLNGSEMWTVEVVGTGDTGGVSILAADTESLGGGGGAVGGETAGYAAGVLVLAAFAFAIARRGGS